MFPWNKMFPFPKEYMKEDIFKQTDVENWMNKAMKGKLPGSPDMLQSTDFFEQSFDLLKQVQSNKKRKKNNKNNGFQPNIFETHDEVFIRFPVSSEDQLSQIKTYYSSNKCFIENAPNNGSKQTVTLPCLVKTSGSIAKYKEGIVEIKIPKETSLPITKIPIELPNLRPKK